MNRRNGRRREDGLEVTELKGCLQPLSVFDQRLGVGNE